MNTKALLVLFLSIGWIWFCQHWHCCWILQSCSVASTTEVIPPPVVPEVEKDPLTFNWENQIPITNAGYEDYIDEVLAELTSDNILEITGQYYGNEPIPEGFDNMGLARADKIRELLSDQLSGERIRLKSHLVTADSPHKDKEFIAHSFNWVLPEVDKPEVIELADKTVILFPFNSYRKVTDPTINDYLKKLAQELKRSGDTVYLTGHTDNIGKAAYNHKLGLKRAKRVRRILINNGVKRVQIKTDSKGMAEPVATNQTDLGRTQNRRVDVRVKRN